MNELYLSIAPHDPIIARDARPLGPGLRMKSLDWPYPSVLAGSVRTMLGKINGSDFNMKEDVEKLKKISV
ncbi:type III-B CRISPR module-associated Cmr3 family protein, partial [Methanoculleus sp. UBA389]